MRFQIAGGLEVEIEAGKSKVLVTAGVFAEGQGPFLVVAIEGDPVLELVPAQIDAEGNEVGGVASSVSPSLIIAVGNPAAVMVEVTLPDGSKVLVEDKFAPLFQAVIDSNAALIKKLGEVLSGAELEALRRELEVVQAELAAEKILTAKLRESLPKIELLASELAALAALLKE